MASRSGGAKNVNKQLKAAVYHSLRETSEQGCQMVSFQTNTPNLGIFWMTLELKILLYIMVIWKFYDWVYFMGIW
jgi:hypothetical protein